MSAMNTFEGLKNKILATYPSVKTLGWADRIGARLWGARSEAAEVWQDARGTFSQSAVLVSWKGKTYTLKFGRLAR
jgi:hypothetical protein